MKTFNIGNLISDFTEIGLNDAEIFTLTLALDNLPSDFDEIKNLIADMDGNEVMKLTDEEAYEEFVEVMGHFACSLRTPLAAKINNAKMEANFKKLQELGGLGDDSDMDDFIDLLGDILTDMKEEADKEGKNMNSPFKDLTKNMDFGTILRHGLDDNEYEEME